MSIKGTYPASPSGRFSVVDTIGVPHPYCITPKHIEVASKYHGGMLDGSAIADSETKGARCGHCKDLSYKEHETALLVGCKVDFKEAKEELETWLKSIVDECTKNGYAGFAFRKDY